MTPLPFNGLDFITGFSRAEPIRAQL